MTNEEVHKNLWSNSVSNYVTMALKLVFGLLMFRMLFQNLSKEEFGFWSLLWSVFGYGILLDFGFGFTAEKRVAELSVHEDWEKLSRVLSTIFYTYVMLGAVIVISVLCFSDPLVRAFHITGENHDIFRTMLIIFFIGMGVTFPLGIFPEILIGQQRIALVNLIFACSIIANYLGLLAAVHFHLGMKVMVMVGLACSVGPAAACGIFALHRLPQVKIRPRYFSIGMIRETTQFSLFAYVITVSNMLLAKSDQLVLGTALTVSAIAIYQAGAKIAEMFGVFAQQLPSVFSPVAAHMHAKGDKTFLRSLLINGTRVAVMIATPAYLICAFYMEALLRVLTGAKTANVETFWIGQVLLLWCYMSVVTQSVTRRIFVMCGHERRLMWVTVAEAGLNLGLSVGLVLYYRNVLCVALGSLVSGFIIGWCVLWPWGAREAKTTGWQLAKTVLIPVWLACLPLVAFLFMGRYFAWLDFRTSLWRFFMEAAVAGLVAAFGLWKYALSQPEREIVLMRLGKIVGKTFAMRTPAL
ncbi:MAG: lipopolysaccharide biosynthesis protein [Limisphaerales bacterium]